MKCPKCQARDTRVTDSRTSVEGDNVRRRRECLECGFRYTTYERVEFSLPMVVKKDGRRETFQREKVLDGLVLATKKRHIPTETIDAIADGLERSLQERGEREVPSTWIGEYVMDALIDLDDVAYVRFASVYKAFEDIDGFKKTLATMTRSKRGKSR